MKEDDVSYVRLYDKKGQELASGEFYQEKGSFPVDIALAPDAQKLAVDMLDVLRMRCTPRYGLPYCSSCCWP